MIVKGNNKLTDNIKTILLIQLGDIGDVVLSFPVLRTLKENMPNAELLIAVRAKAAALAAECQWADGVVSINTVRRNFPDAVKHQLAFIKSLWSYRIDVAIDLRMDPRGAVLAMLSRARQRIGFFAEDGKLWRNRIFTHLYYQGPVPGGRHMTDYLLNLVRAFGISTVHTTPEIPPSADTQKKIAQLLESNGFEERTPLIAIQPFSLWSYKEWDIEKYAQLIQWLISTMTIKIIITGSADEYLRAEALCKRLASGDVINLAGKTDTGMLPALFRQCRLFIGPDSAGLHIAAAAGTPTVGIFGPAAARVWAPKGKQHSVVQKNFDCVPCNLKGCNGSGKSRCIDALTVAEVTSPVAKQLGITY
ncbi:MAG: glycosyltransferase family 9 protein [Thermodesulfobacteriota bacterium]|nr:glycosyltransferase family 9 protein [Thermodesulfobacteriota bacterium]